MAIKISRASETHYEAEVSPPESREPWKTPAPLPLRELINELKHQGCHQTDISDVLYELEPNWVSKLN
mgnify:CR=1 FL=1